MLSLSYDPQLSRVWIAADGLPPEPVTVERSTDQVRWATVRGGAGITPVGGEILLDDYEFAADVENWYRVAGQTASITPVLDGVWLKSIARPFLNRRIEVRDFSPLRRVSRSGVFEVVGRSLPVVVTDLRSSRRYTLEINTRSDEDAEALDLLLSTGEVVFVHTPTTGRLRAVPSGYFAVGDSDETVLPTLDLDHRVFSVSLTECAPPGPDVVPASQTWDSLIGALDWDSEVITQYATWDELAALVGDPGEVIVP